MTWKITFGQKTWYFSTISQGSLYYQPNRWKSLKITIRLNFLIPLQNGSFNGPCFHPSIKKERWESGVLGMTLGENPPESYPSQAPPTVIGHRRWHPTPHSQRPDGKATGKGVWFIGDVPNLKIAIDFFFWKIGFVNAKNVGFQGLLKKETHVKHDVTLFPQFFWKFRGFPWCQLLREAWCLQELKEWF